MSPLFRPIPRALISLASLAVLAVPAAARHVPASGPDSTVNALAAAPADSPAAAPGFKLSGYAEASYTYSNQAVAGMIVGRLYDRYSDAFVLNAWKLSVDRPFDPKKLDAGAHADLLVGQNAAVTKSIGFDLGTNGDVTQLYAVLNIPTSNGNGVQFKVGKMVTLMGLEVIEDVANPNWSLGNQFNWVENFTSTGLEFDAKPSGKVDIELRVDNGWDRITPTDGPKDFMGRIGIAGGPNTTLGILGYWGRQHPTVDAARYGAEVLLNQKFGKTSIWIQGDWGMEAANDSLPDPTQDAKWWAVGGWLASDLSPKVNLAIRGDYMVDSQGARTFAPYALPLPGVEHKLWSVTGTLNLKAWSNCLVRPEVRYDHSSFTVFNGKGEQVSVALSAAYLY
jgi:hypothetical protein